MRNYDIAGSPYSEPETAAEAMRPDIIESLESAIEWQDDEPRVNWESVWDRMEGDTLADGMRLALPSDLGSPVFRALQKHGRAFRAQLN